MSQPLRIREYIGDAVYVIFDGWAYTLQTDDGLEVTNRIYLEPEVLIALNRFVAHCEALRANAKPVSTEEPDAATD